MVWQPATMTREQALDRRAKTGGWPANPPWLLRWAKLSLRYLQAPVEDSQLSLTPATNLQHCSTDRLR